MNRLDAMQSFVRVAELASFTKAADSLGLPKASVSTSIQQLESMLNTRLLHRTTRKVQLTQDGQVYYERCKDLLADMDELEGLFQQGASNLTGRLRVDMPSNMAKMRVIPRLPELLAQHPQLQVEISSTDRRVDVIREGFDCVVRVGKLSDSSLIARPLGKLELLNCVSPDYIAQFGTPQTLDDLANHQLVHYVTTLGSKSPGFEYTDQGDVKFIAMTGNITVNNSDAYSAACIAGFGIAQIPRIGVQDYLAQGKLVEVLKNYRAESMPVSLIYPNRRNLSRRVQVFMDWIATLMTDYVDIQ
ncbi:LysR family transcriptional regulator [Cellvibrio fibrivorans]|uniref:DNA-binding transcriptional LysR family regulator n=1 Tax=Cellvibrio fibrivorans TaxID=126350 RepID=A0ABU1V1D0_9GAMM|nr:LysR family transcriptional regulator [Cellvibrio fibrivorans]MDR7091261.1 DNA-binding transcriptional LysR family regulator [Cellvibrio fibrivorans]